MPLPTHPLTRSPRGNIATRATVIAALLSCVLLASPFTGLGIAAGRLFMMAYLPAAVVLAFLLTHLRSTLATWAALALVFVITAASALGTMGRVARPCIPESSYPELCGLRSYLDQPPRTLIVARHGLEWWAAWALGTHVCQDFAVRPDTWDRYDRVLLLQQTAAHAHFGPQGPVGPPFREVRIPPDAEILFEGDYFRLAVAPRPPGFHALRLPQPP